MVRLLGIGAVSVLFLVALVACGGAPSGPGATGTSTQVVATATPTAESTETQEVEAEGTVEPSGTQMVVPTATAGVAGEGGQTPPEADLTNPWPKILSMTPAPEGWGVQPCEGDGPFLCVAKAGEHIGFVHLSTFPLETMTNFQEMLAEAGAAAETYDYTDPQDAEKVREALYAFVEDYHSILENDRQATYQGQKQYRRLETKDVSVGDLPAVSYGFTIVNPDESIHERWLSYSTFDGEGLFTIVASFYPDRELSFRSDEELLEFEPSLQEIVNWLRLPHPEVKGDKTRG